MTKQLGFTGSELFVVDNSDKYWKVLRYLRDWCHISKKLDIATGFFEIGSLLALENAWQNVDEIRILMGNEVSQRTQSALLEGMKRISESLDTSIESEKLQNDFLEGVPAIVEGIRSKKILCKVYTKSKFHAKAYITHARMEVVGSAALVGSSNFSLPGLTDNVELNVQITGRPVATLQEWYEQHWNEAEDVSEEILRVIERHTRAYSPFEVYAKSLHEFFRGHELTDSEWEEAGLENGGSRMFPVLDRYQQEGYRTLMKIVRQHGGAFLCDGVGLGKTFIGLMLIERLIVNDKKDVVLLAPKGARESVWEPALKQYLGYLRGAFSHLEILNHTDLQRGNEFPQFLKSIRERADAIVIDEGHNFRNPGQLGELADLIPGVTRPGRIRGVGRTTPSRYWRLYEMLEDARGVKQVFFLTATPINNRLLDFLHMVELFTRRKDNYFGPTVGINSLRGHFRTMEKELRRQTEGAVAEDIPVETDLAEAQEMLSSDAIFKALVVQRSRAYVKESQERKGDGVTAFPEREPPNVVEYSIKKTYGRLLGMIDTAFDKDKPLFTLAMYYPLFYYEGTEPIDRFAENRQKQVVGLIRTQFLKRFESSSRAFQRSCERLFIQLMLFAEKHSETPAEKKRLEQWQSKNRRLIECVHEHRTELWDEDSDEAGEDLITEEMLEEVQPLPREEYKVGEMLTETFLDLDQTVEFLKELDKFKPENDDKLNALKELLKTDRVLKKNKVLIFTEYADTARYLSNQLEEDGLAGVERVDSSTPHRQEIIRRFSPYYNDSSSGEIARKKASEIRILISTDVLSEGLNLQDATRLINYDIHWNPVRLMQRIGRVDRRLNPAIEKKIIADHPEQEKLRGKVAYWNFLPPEELDELLRLYGKVAHKTLRISKTFGIEGKKLLTPEDEYEALREFNHKYEGDKSLVEKMHLEYQELLEAHPELAKCLDDFPGRVFSGKEHPKPDTQAVFFCYALPALDTSVSSDVGEPIWSEEAGITKWYLYNLEDESVTDNPADIVAFIRSDPDTHRHCSIEKHTLSDIRSKIDKHIKNTYLKQVQAPVGVRPTLKAWMELS